MDKELLRVVIIATGLLIVTGMLAWHFLKNKKSLNFNFFDSNEIKNKISELLNLHPERDNFDVEPKKKSPRYAVPEEKPEAMFADFDEDFDFEEEDYEQATRFVVPEIIQFSLVAKTNEGFNGLDLFNAFQIVGLEYGSLKIFERLDEKRQVDFSVACLVKPGTFPNTQIEAFYCPGVVFFMQPAVLDNPQVVFDDFVETVKLMTIELDGEALDHERKPLTDATIQLIRRSL